MNKQLQLPTPDRAAFITYLIALQAILLYIRTQAKLQNDQTEITLGSPLSSLLQSQIGGGSSGGSGILKSMASSFLATTSTIVDYDLKQANNMQSGLIMNMMFMWFLHFKMQQVQPLLVQSITGFANMIYSPLFQVYVLGRNLERPFKSPTPPAASESTTQDNKDKAVDGGDKVKEVKVIEEVTITRKTKGNKGKIDGASISSKATLAEPVVEVEEVDVSEASSSEEDEDNDDDDE
jgi:Phosphate transport (Pho88)